MKKLMIAAAIVCAAAFANAAVFTWGGDLAMMDNNGVNASGTVEFFLDGTSLGVVDISEGMVSFSYDLNAWGTVSALATIANFSDGTGTRTWSQAIDSAWLAGYPDADSANMELVSVANMNLLNGEGLDFTQTAAANGYTAVPEPTSGLLLLLGVAGLALRRRRA